MIRSLLLAVVALCSASSAYSQQPCNYINADSAVKHLPEYAQAALELRWMEQRLQDSATAIYTRIDRIYGSFGGPRTPTQLFLGTLQLRQLEFEAQQHIQRYQKRMLDTRDQLVQQCRMKLNKEVKSFCEESQLSCMIEARFALHCNNCVDRTSEFIRYLYARQHDE